MARKFKVGDKIDWKVPSGDRALLEEEQIKIYRNNYGAGPYEVIKIRNSYGGIPPTVNFKPNSKNLLDSGFFTEEWFVKVQEGSYG